MPIPNRLDLVARPFARRWQRAWTALAPGDTADRDELLDRCPALVRELESMAYRLLRWRRGARHLLAMARRPERLPAGLAPWFQNAPGPAESPRMERLQLRFSQLATPVLNGDREHATGSTAELRILLAGWQWVTEAGADAGPARDPAETGPWQADHPTWHALLRLRPLREFWVHQLRAKHLAALAEVLPPAWIIDPAPLPPGAVLPGLGAWTAMTNGSEPPLASGQAEPPMTGLKAWPQLPLWGWTTHSGPQNHPEPAMATVRTVAPLWSPAPVGTRTGAPGWDATFRLDDWPQPRPHLLGLG